MKRKELVISALLAVASISGCEKNDVQEESLSGTETMESESQIEESSEAEVSVEDTLEIFSEETSEVETSKAESDTEENSTVESSAEEETSIAIKPNSDGTDLYPASDDTAIEGNMLPYDQFVFCYWEKDGAEETDGVFVKHYERALVTV